MINGRQYAVKYFPLSNRVLLSPILSGSPYPNYRRYKSRILWFARFTAMVNMVKRRKVRARKHQKKIKRINGNV